MSLLRGLTVSSEKNPAYVGTAQRYRRLGPVGRVLLSLLFVSLPVLGLMFIGNVPGYLGYVMYREQFVALFLGLSLVCIFIGLPAGRKAPVDRVPWYDFVLATAALVPAGFIFLHFPEVVNSLGDITTRRVVFGAMLIVLVLEGTRRTVGWPLVILVSAFTLYGRYADWFPGVLNASPTPWPRLINYLYLDTNSYLSILGIATTVVLGFIVFGQILHNFGGGKFIIDLSYAMLGRFRGGPAKVAIVSSSLFGTISGSAVANVIVTGVITIPMMKETGLRPHQAGAVEAVSSTGGQLVPPVMGVAAFLIAEFLEIQYTDVVIAAIIPAFLYYMALFVQVDAEAAKEGRAGLPRDRLPRFLSVFRKGWYYLLSLVFLIYVLFIVALTPSIAGALAAAFTLILVVMHRHGRENFFRRVYTVFEESGKTLLDIGIVLTAAGLIMGIMAISGLGFNLSFALIQLAKGSMLLMLIFSAIVCLVLGMGMPTTAAYVLVAVLVAPALKEMGIAPLAAHLFIFYYAILSVITPPVSLASFAAAAIAGSEPMRTSFEAMRLALVAYIVPFLFVYSPVLIAEGPLPSVLLGLATACVAVWVLGAAAVGFLFRRLSWWKRIALAVGGILLLIPIGIGASVGWISDIIGALIVVPLMTWEWRARGTGTVLVPR